MKKIGFLVDNYPLPAGEPQLKPGGIGTYPRVVGEELASRGHEVHLFVQAPVRRHRTIEAGGVRVWLCPRWERRSEMTPAQALTFTLRHGNVARKLTRYSLTIAVARAARSQPFDLIEAPDLGGYGALLETDHCQRDAVRFHCAFVDDRTSDPRFEAWDRSRRSGPMFDDDRVEALRADVLTAPTKATARTAGTFFSAELGTIPVVGNPVPQPDPSRWRQRGGTGAVLFGRLYHQKGVDVAARATVRVRERFPDFRLTLIGPDIAWDDQQSTVQMARKIVAEAGCPDAVRALPPAQPPELIDLIREHAVCVLPSRWETFGLTALEAMAWGMPCVLSRIPPFEEIGNDGVNCLLADWEDDADLARGIVELLEDSARAERMAEAAKAHAARWFAPRMVDDLLAAWFAPEPAVAFGGSR